MTIRILPLIAAMMACAALGVPGADAQEGHATRINGTIESRDGRTLIVKEADDKLIAFEIAPQGLVVSNQKMNIADIKPGEYIAIDTVKKDGKDVTVQAHTQDFAHGANAQNRRPMTTLEGGTRSLGQVTAVAPAQDGVNLKITGVKGGEMDFTLTPGIVHYKNEADSVSDLKPGMRVMATANRSADGKLASGFVTVEKNGAMPVDIGY